MASRVKSSRVKSSSVKTGRVKRGYDSSRRQAHADQTRRHIIETVRPLFIEDGYQAVSMRHVAEAAGVSVQTLYNAFHSKFGLFAALMEVIVAGGHEPVAVVGRPEVRELATIDDPTALIRAVVAAATPVLVRLEVIYPTLRAAVVSDHEVAAAHQRFALDARYDEYRRLGSRLQDVGALPASTDATRAADILWTVLSPDTYHLLAGQRGWSPTEFQAWAADTLVATLVSPTGAH